MTYRLVLTFSYRGQVGEQTFHADSLAGVAREASRYANQFTLSDCDGADIYASGDLFALNPEPLLTATDVAAFIAEWEDGVAA
jgi:hypothetical protein